MIGLLNPSIGSPNTGDQVIAEASRKVIGAIGISAFELPTQRRWSSEERTIAKSVSSWFLGGTNLLSSDARYRQWVLGDEEIALLEGKVILLGVGWWQYQGPMDDDTKSLYSRLFHPEAVHSVRDEYTLAKLSPLGLKIEVTGCHTLWELEGSALEFPQAILNSRPVTVATVTDYARNPALDWLFLLAVSKLSSDFVVWPQGEGDAKYAKQLGFGRHLIAPGLENLDAGLKGEFDLYLGTRLHGAIRALQFGVPAVVIAVDNRATEVSKDFGLWCLERREVPLLRQNMSSLGGSLRLRPDSVSSFLNGIPEILDVSGADS